MNIKEFYDYCWARGFNTLSAQHASYNMIDTDIYSECYLFDKYDYEAHCEEREQAMREHFAKLCRSTEYNYRYA